MIKFVGGILEEEEERSLYKVGSTLKMKYSWEDFPSNGI